MSAQAMSWAVRQITGNPLDRLLLLMIADGIDAGGDYWPPPPPARLAVKCEMTEAEIGDRLDSLEAHGFVRREVRVPPWGGNAQAVVHLPFSEAAKR